MQYCIYYKNTNAYCEVIYQWQLFHWIQWPVIFYPPKLTLLYFPFVRKGQTHSGQLDSNASTLMLPLNKKSLFLPVYFILLWSRHLLPFLHENSLQETSTNLDFIFLSKNKLNYWSMFLRKTQKTYQCQNFLECDLEWVTFLLLEDNNNNNNFIIIIIIITTYLQQII